MHARALPLPRRSLHESIFVWSWMMQVRHFCAYRLHSLLYRKLLFHHSSILPIRPSSTTTLFNLLPILVIKSFLPAKNSQLVHVSILEKRLLKKYSTGVKRRNPANPLLPKRLGYTVQRLPYINRLSPLHGENILSQNYALSRIQSMQVIRDQKLIG